MVQQRSRGGSALFWGIIFGLVLAVLIVLERVVATGLIRRAVVLRGGVGIGVVGVLFSSGVAVFVTLALYFLAGALAARRARALEAGLFAGMIAGAIAGITRLALALLALGALRPLPTAVPSRLRLDRLLAAGTFVSAVVALVTDILIGTGLGALGGLIGRGSAPAPPPPAMSYQPYPPGQPAAGSPPPAPYPPQQGPFVPGQDVPLTQTPAGDYPTTPSSLSPLP